MARLIRHDAHGPALIQIGDETVAVCQCGLSLDKPFCDGSHTKTKDEDVGKLYAYNSEGGRVAIEDLFPHPARVFTRKL